MALTTGIVVFPGMEELDCVGPWEVFAMARRDGDRVVTIAEHGEPVAANLGMRIVPDHTFADAPRLDVVVVPGGFGTRREVDNPVLLQWLAGAAATATWVTSVCTGALLLHAAGLVGGRRVTTHWAMVDTMRGHGVEVVDDARYVRDGNVVTAAGVSAGIDMALWIVGQVYDVDHARAVRKMMEYDPAPPYGALV
ncbi:MAG TPA: DJ-1/PfpI family protein [Acidimicrobiia bacterium]|nr:DJ-1/PfpI family protein [Acidimicrobiia bacterium]